MLLYCLNKYIAEQLKCEEVSGRIICRLFLTALEQLYISKEKKAKNNIPPHLKLLPREKCWDEGATYLQPDLSDPSGPSETPGQNIKSKEKAKTKSLTPSWVLLRYYQGIISK